MNYYIIAGEASGDLHASNLMRELRRRDPAARFRCWGGDLMQEQGGTLVKHYREMAYMGFVEVLTHLPAIFRNIRLCKQDLLEYRPNVLILVDFPGFNLRIAEFAKEQGIPVFYYISPKIWAWNQKRVLKIKRIVDKMFCILPFEVDFYRSWGMEVDYIGNPLADAVAAWEAAAGLPGQERAEEGAGLRGQDRPEESAGNKVIPGTALQETSSTPAEGVDEGSALPEADVPVIALLPGSRKQEITRILPEMLKATERFKDYKVVIAGAPSFSVDFYAPFIGSHRPAGNGKHTGNKQISVVFGGTYDLLHSARAALVTSGTATLETALLNVPQAVLYKANALSVAIARRVVKIKFISLVNLIAGKEVVKELIQEDCNPGRIAAELDRLLHDEPCRARMFANYAELRELVGGPGASARAAEKMLQYLSE